MSLIKMRLDDAMMESLENGESTDQVLNKVSNIRSGIVKLISTSLIRWKTWDVAEQIKM